MNRNISVLVGMFLVVLMSANLFAASTWDGGGGDGNWSTAANWDGDSVPTNGAALTFGGSLWKSNTNDLLTSVGAVVFNGAGWVISGDAVTLNARMSYSGTWNIDSDLATGIICYGKWTGLTFNGVLSGSGSLMKWNGADYDNNLKIVRTNNTFTGKTHTGSGRTYVYKLADAGQPSSLGAPTGGNATISIGASGTSYGSKFIYAGSTDSASDRPLAFVFPYGGYVAFNNDSPTDASLTLSGNWSGSGVVGLLGNSAGTNYMNGVIGGNLGINVGIDGAWVFTAANPMWRDININRGTLLVNNSAGSGTGSGNVNVNSGGILGGSGTITLANTNKAVTVNSGGTLAPGDPLVDGGVGELSVSSNLVINGNANLFYDTGIGAADHVALDGDLMLSTNVLVTINLVGDKPLDTEWKFPLVSATTLSGGSNVMTWVCTNDVYEFTAYVEGDAVWVKRPAPAFMMILR